MRNFLIIMLLNFSNHPSSQWPEKQMEEAQKMFGNVMDMPFPAIAPDATEEELLKLAEEHLNKILHIKNEHPNMAVHIMGELTFTFLMVQLLHREGISCYASTTQRMAQEIKNDGDIKKVSIFQFCKFRKYPVL